MTIKIMNPNTYLFMLILSLLLYSVSRSSGDELGTHNLFEKYNILKEMQGKPMLFFLEKIEWQKTVALSGNWFDTVRYFPRDISQWNWNKATLDYCFSYDNKKKRYFLFSHNITIAKSNTNVDTYCWQDAFNGDVCFNADGKVMQMSGPFWDIAYHDNGLLAEFSFCNKDIFKDVEMPRYIEWNENGEKISDAYAEKKHNYWDDVWIEDEYLNDLKKLKSLNGEYTLDQQLSYMIKYPQKLSSDIVITSLKNISDYYKSTQSGLVKKLLEVPGFHDRPKEPIYITFEVSKNALISVRCEQLLNNGHYACYLQFNEHGKLLQYQLGMFKEVKNTNSIGFVTKENRQYKLEGGIEVKFHSTCYPATYKTIVKNRLFGRQVEWNDKGEVISDIDLDIPKPWFDAPKKEVETTK